MIFTGRAGYSCASAGRPDITVSPATNIVIARNMRPPPLSCISAQSNSAGVAIYRRRSLNHLVRAQQQWRRNGDPQHLRGLQVDDQLELSRLLDGEIGGLCAMKNPVDKGG